MMSESVAPRVCESRELWRCMPRYKERHTKNEENLPGAAPSEELSISDGAHCLGRVAMSSPCGEATVLAEESEGGVKSRKTKAKNPLICT